jgi:predicted ATPase
MPILSFSYQSDIYGWKLNEVSLEDFNLLVGISGVGKTNILRTIEMIRTAGTHETGSYYANGSEWVINFEVDGDAYDWSAEVSISAPAAFSAPRQNGVTKMMMSADLPYFTYERLTKNGKELVTRNETGAIRFAGEDYLRLRNTESVISLLSNEPLIAPVFHFFNQITFSDSIRYAADAQELISEVEILSIQKAEEVKEYYKEFEQLQQLRGVPLLLKMYLLQENFPLKFERLKDQYCEIFPTVTEIAIAKFEEMAPAALSVHSNLNGSLALGIKEKGVKNWILGHLLSRGMLRTLIHLFELEMMPSGSIVLVDEFEDGLGINCLDAVTEIFLSHLDKQFILTSHHPYIISKIPLKYWKLVSRKGATVTVKNADSVYGLDSHSLLSGFVQLTNLENEYVEAIQ